MIDPFANSLSGQVAGAPKVHAESRRRIDGLRREIAHYARRNEPAVGPKPADDNINQLFPSFLFHLDELHLHHRRTGQNAQTLLSTNLSPQLKHQNPSLILCASANAFGREPKLWAAIRYNHSHRLICMSYQSENANMHKPVSDAVPVSDFKSCSSASTTPVIIGWSPRR